MAAKRGSASLSEPRRHFRRTRGRADLLIQAAASDRAERANLIFPALFNYRHYVELALKYLITEYGSYAAVALGAKGHKLMALWGEFEKVCEKFGHDINDEAMSAVRSCVAELEIIDVSSTVFRYATDLRGHTPPLPAYGLDLVALHDVMNGIEGFFEAVDMANQSTIDEMHQSYNP